VATKVERWVTADGSEFETRAAAEEHDLVESVVSRCLEPAAWNDAKWMLRAMLANGYEIIPPPQASAA